MGIPDDKLALLNKSATERTWHRLPSKIGGGIQAYFEGFHQIHCLVRSILQGGCGVYGSQALTLTTQNLVRQYTYRHEYDYSNLRDFANVKIPITEHVEHCLEILRTKLMCDADTTPFLAHWNNEEGITIDTTTSRKCRNFGNMVDWANSHITVPFEEHNH
jgi:hypothetical protein